MRKKLCYIIPEYRSGTDTHFNSLYALIGNAARDMDIFLIVERGDQPDFVDHGKIYVQKCSFFPLRAAENFLVILSARLRGYGDFYIHYSFLSALNASFIVRMTGGRTFYWNCGLPWRYGRSFFRDLFERLTYYAVTFLVTGTEGLKKQYAEHYRLSPAKIKIFPNWIDLAVFRQRAISPRDLRMKLHISDSEKVVLFVHRLSRRKGAHHLPEIVRALGDESAVLVIAGRGPEQGNIESEIRKSGLSQKVRFLESVPNREIRDYFGIADVFILPSEEEGFPHVLLESMAASVPFAAFDVGGVREIVPPELRDYLVPAENVGAFIQKMKELVRATPEKRETLGRHELEWVRQFDIASAAGRFKNLFT